ncbi:DNA mismatch repair protein MutL [Wolfiporia cocos MD-104 SS10]|uniref:DNA mismatch repair protein MutL n=1 Tax=Wolfiporia cocos (strain MD-104) TaxID=742152 RepID=A0A2H3JRX4_WOLCO|nr:DNA mismatch repair protein MutL [Wolfiporia cocos MD-104 SS10]
MTTQARSPSPTPDGPLPIRRLQESVINRIAAGEIIQRPASALKELIENSLDAGSMSIKITVKDGGMKLLQIQDSGCGIRKADLPILAERFTTSKLSTFSDLARLTTYGFRGEALASISYVSHLTVITKTKTDSCAWKACYADGALAAPRGTTSSEPKACAGNDGTTITVENLFYNTPTRLSALRSSSEEYARILDVVTKYAIHNPHVSFTCKKAGSSAPDVSTPSASTTAQAIRLLYGQTIAKDLLYASISASDQIDATSDASSEDKGETWSAEAHFTNAHYHAKKTVLLLFINHRLVESLRIKKALESIYNGILPKGASPFIYLSLQIDPQSVDVNVHPTKREVHFLDEETIIERIASSLQQKLIGQSQSRVFEYQTLLTGGIAESQNVKGKGKERENQRGTEESPTSDRTDSPSMTPSSQKPRKTLSQHKVRTSLQDRTLESMFPVTSSQTAANGGSGSKAADFDDSSPVPNPLKTREIKASECSLTSVQKLRRAIVQGTHRQLHEILEKHTFVGIVDVNRCLSLIQYSTKLYLVNHGALAEELFYQLGLRQFGNICRIKLDPPPPLKDLVKLAVDVEEGIERSSLSRPQIVDRIVDVLMARREMLSEYFSLDISADGAVESIPMLLRNYTPNLDKLPLFLMRLGPQVNWASERECFESFLRELAFFYVPEPLSPTHTDEAPQSEAEDKSMRWQLQHVLFPAIARYLVAPKSLLDRDVVQVANLPDLYRVFERC